MTKKLPDLFDDAEENRALMVPFAVRDDIGIRTVTGYTWGKMAHSIDIYKIIGEYVEAMPNPGRALRLCDYLRGKALRNFPWTHRDQLRSDIAGLARCLSKGGYSADE